MNLYGIHIICFQNNKYCALCFLVNHPSGIGLFDSWSVTRKRFWVPYKGRIFVWLGTLRCQVEVLQKVWRCGTREDAWILLSPDQHLIGVKNMIQLNLICPAPDGKSEKRDSIRCCESLLTENRGVYIGARMLTEHSAFLYLTPWNIVCWALTAAQKDFI